MRKSILRWFLCLILLSIPLMVTAQNQRDDNNRNDDWNTNQSSRYDSQTGWSIEGQISKIDYGGNEIRIKTDQSSNYTIYAANAAIYTGNIKRDIDSLHRGDRITVYGREIEDNCVEARAIYASINDSYYDQFDPDARNYRKPRAVGNIRSINLRNGRIRLTGDAKYSIVVVDRATKIYKKSGKRLTLAQLRRGDDIKVSGEQIRSNTIHAIDIYISINGSIWDPYKSSSRADYYNPNARNYNNARAVGEIRSIDTRRRQIRITGDSKFNTLVVDSTTKIYAKSGKRLSLNQLRSGDDIKVSGGRIGNSTIHAVKIYISINGSIWNPSGSSYDDDYDNNGYNGTQQSSIRIMAVIRNVDLADSSIEIRNSQNYNAVVVTRSTKIYAQNGRITSLRNLQEDDSIRIIGYSSREKEITATEIRQQ